MAPNVFRHSLVVRHQWIMFVNVTNYTCGYSALRMDFINGLKCVKIIAKIA